MHIHPKGLNCGFYCLLFFSLFSNYAFAQILVNKNGGFPHPSSMLHVQSDNAGFLPPQLTTAQRKSINNPAPGLMVFDIDEKCIYFFDGEVWQPICGKIDLKKGLLAHYPFDGNTLDVGGSGYHGIPSGNPVYTTNAKGEAIKAIKLDGINDFVIINDGGALSIPEFSISLCLKLDVVKYGAIVNRVNFTTGNNFTWGTAAYASVFGQGNLDAFSVQSPAVPCSSTNAGGIADQVLSNRIAQKDVWYHYVFVFSKGWQKLYIDGELVGMKKRDFENAKTCSNSQMLVGSWWLGDQTLFSGDMDELRVYGRELSIEEIKELSSCRDANNDL